MRYLSVCSGIEAATVAWHHMGWQPAAFSEIEPFPSAVLAHHYPEVPNLGDMTRYKDWNLEPIGLLVGGTPCQAFSVAGLRGGLSDARGNLSLTFCEMADHFDPEWVLWENVPGVLSSKDNAFGCFLAGLSGASEPLVSERGWDNAGLVVGPKRTVAWRVCDAQFHGVAQRRRRVFVLAVRGSGNWASATALFPLGNGVHWDSPPSREARKAASRGAASSVDERGIQHTVGALTDGAHNGGGSTDKTLTRVAYSPPVANCLTQRMHKGINTTLDEGQTPIVTTGGVFDVVQPVAGTLGNRGLRSHTELDGHGAYIPVAIHPHVVGRAPTAGPQGKEYIDDGSAYCMDARGVPQMVAQPTAMQVRRLTPVECERLQGFPDGYTAIPWRNKPASECPDGPRYKAVGYSMAVLVMRWIGERINQVEAL